SSSSAPTTAVIASIDSCSARTASPCAASERRTAVRASGRTRMITRCASCAPLSIAARRLVSSRRCFRAADAAVVVVSIVANPTTTATTRHRLRTRVLIGFRRKQFLRHVFDASQRRASTMFRQTGNGKGCATGSAVCGGGRKNRGQQRLAWASAAPAKYVAGGDVYFFGAPMRGRFYRTVERVDVNGRRS